MGIIDDQARDLVLIVKSDTAGLPESVIAIAALGAGNLIVLTEAAAETAKDLVNADNPTDAQIITAAVAAGLYITLTGVPAGFVLNCRIYAVFSTGTTATNLVGYLP